MTFLSLVFKTFLYSRLEASSLYATQWNNNEILSKSSADIDNIGEMRIVWLYYILIL